MVRDILCRNRECLTVLDDYFSMIFCRRVECTVYHALDKVRRTDKRRMVGYATEAQKINENIFFFRYLCLDDYLKKTKTVQHVRYCNVMGKVHPNGSIWRQSSLSFVCKTIENFFQ